MLWERKFHTPVAAIGAAVRLSVQATVRSRGSVVMVLLRSQKTASALRKSSRRTVAAPPGHTDRGSVTMAHAKSAPTSHISRTRRMSSRPATNRVQQCAAMAKIPVKRAMRTRPTPGTNACGASSRRTRKSSSATNGMGLSFACASAVWTWDGLAETPGRHHSAPMRLPATPSIRWSVSPRPWRRRLSGLAPD